MTIALCTTAEMASAQIFQQIGVSDHYETTTAPLVDGVVIGSPGVAPLGVGLLVDGANLNTPTGEVFRTVTPTGQNGFWRAYRNTIELGRIYTTNPGQGFHVRAVQANDPNNPGILWLENNDADGFMLRANGLQAVNVNSYPLLLDGFASLGIRNNGTAGMPSRARFQLVDHDAQAVVEPWRPYFRNGVLFTGNNDMGYIGHVYHDASNGTTPWTYTLDRSDLVISAGENSLSEATRQRIRFTYSTTPVAGGTGAESYNGLEFMQLFPFNKDQGYVGVGDFTAVGQNPTERLHMRNGRLRIEQLPSDPVANTLTKVMVVDDTPGANFGVVRWRDASTLGGAACDWTVSAGPNHVWTATGALNPNCPDATENVGIGLTVPVAKLDVARTVNSGGATSLGFNLLMTTNSANNTGANIDVQTVATTTNLGLRSTVRNAGQNWAIDGVAAANNTTGTGAFTGGRVVGVRGFADGNFITTRPNLRGVWGIAVNAGPAGGAGYAGWFDGDVNIQGGNLFINQVFAISDASVKTNVEDLLNAGDIIAQLAPKSYFFDTLTHPELKLPSDLQRGLLATDVEQVMPELVMEVEHEALYDSLGNETAPAYTLKTVNYLGFIPVLLAEAKDLRSTVQSQAQTISALQQQLGACCLLDSDTRMQEGNGIGYIDNNRQPDATASAPLAKNALVVIPNPFQENPTISYRIGTSGRAQLRVADGQGRAMGTLMDAGMQAGQHTMVWNTAGMAAGTYWLTLTLDGERITTQAVMVD